MATKTIKIKKSEVDQKTLNISETLQNLSNSIITPNDVRLALMDYPEMNKPLYIEHLDDEKLWKCIDWGVGTFNSQPPNIGKYTAENFPDKQLLLLLAVVEALKLTALMELRGEMQYSDGGVQSSIYYKSPQFTALRQELQQQASQNITAIKRSMNINSCYGHLC